MIMGVQIDTVKPGDGNCTLNIVKRMTCGVSLCLSFRAYVKVSLDMFIRRQSPAFSRIFALDLRATCRHAGGVAILLQSVRQFLVR